MTWQSRNQYEKIRLLGEGRFSKVFLVKKLIGSGLYAVKEIELGKLRQICKHDEILAEKASQSATDKVALMTSLQHDNIIRVFGSFLLGQVPSGTAGSVLHIAMEFSEAGSLESAIIAMQKENENRLFDEAQILRWTKQLAEALLFLHENGVPHRDVKTKNIFLFGENQQTVKLGDFGIFLDLKSLVPGHKQKMENLLYCSPEFLDGHLFGLPDDVWALGVVVHRVASLDFPFNGETEKELKISMATRPTKTKFASDRLQQLTNALLVVSRKDRPTLKNLVASFSFVPEGKQKDVKVAMVDSVWQGHTIHSAAAADRIDIVEHFIKNGVGVDVPDGDNKDRTCLHHAASRGHDKMVKWLLERGASVFAKSSKDDNEITAIHLAAYHGYLSTVELFVDEDASLMDVKDSNGELPIHKAALGGRIDVVEYFTRFNDINQTDDGKRKQTCLHYAADKGHLELVRWLVDNGANVEAKSSKDSHEQLPIHAAAFAGRLPVVQFFVDLNPDLQVEKDGNGDYPIHKAALSGRLEVVAYFLRLGLNIEIPDAGKRQRTCLHKAAGQGHLELVRWLVDRGALHCPKSSQEDFENTPIHLAAGEGHLHVVEFFVEKWPELKRAKNSDGSYPIHVAASKGRLEVVKFFIASGIAVDVRDEGKWRRNCLHRAAANGHLSLVRWLVRNGANLKAKSSKEDSEMLAVHFAAFAGDLNMVRFFVRQNPKLMTANNGDGDFPIHLAALGGHIAVVEYFFEAGVDLDVADCGKSTRTCLHIAASKGHFALVKWLVRNFANVFAKTSKETGENLPVHLAAYFGHLAVVNFFIDRFPDVTSLKNGDGNDLIHQAALGGNVDLVRYLIDLGFAVDKPDDGKTKRTCLHNAAANGHLELVKFLLEKLSNGAQYVKSSQADGENLPVHLAAHFGHLETVKFFIDSWPELMNVTTCEGDYPIHLAALGGHLTVVDYLTSLGVDVNLADDGKLKRTCLHCAAGNGHLELVEWLLENGAELTAKSSPECDKNLAVHFAAIFGHLAVVEFFLVIEPNLATTPNARGHYPMHQAALGGQRNVVEYFVRNGFDTDERDDGDCKRTSLHHAASKGRLELVEWLVETLGADVLAQTSLKDVERLPIHLAAFHGHLEVVRLFVKKRSALKDATDRDGNLPIHHAALGGHLAVVQFFTNELGFDVKMRDQGKARQTCLHKAAGSNGGLELVKWLIRKGLEVNDTSSQTDNEQMAVHFAAFFGQLPVVKFFFENYPHLKEATDSLGDFPIHKAAIGGQIDVVGYLLKSGTRLDLPDAGKLQQTCLHKAVEVGELEMVKWLVEKGADVAVRSSKDDFQNAPIHMAAFLGQLDMVKFFVEKFPELTLIANGDGNFPIHMATLGSQVDVIEYFVSEGLSLDVPGGGDLKRSCLHKVAEVGDLQMSQWLLEKGANSFAKSSEIDLEKLPVHVAAFSGHPPVLEFFLKKSPTLLNATDLDGNFLIHQAALGGQLNVVQYFINQKPGIDINLTDDGRLRRTCLHMAAGNGHLRLVQWLVENRADVLQKSSLDDFEKMPVHLAAYVGHFDIVKFFIEKSPELKTAKDGEGDFPIHMAALGGQIKVIEYFIGEPLSMKVDVRDEGRLKRTCLHKAADNGHLHLVKWLVAKSANVYAQSSPEDLENMPVHLSAFFGRLAVVKFFLERFPDLLVATNGEGDYPIHKAALGGQLGIVKFFLGLGINADIRDEGNLKRTCLHKAAETGNLELVKLLLAYGADPFLKSSELDNERTPAHLAAALGHAAVLRYLMENNPGLASEVDGSGRRPGQIF